MTDLTDVPSWLRDPEPAEVSYTLISVDDHLVEPPEMFEGRLPQRLQDRAPRVIEVDQRTLAPADAIEGDGHQLARERLAHAWVYEDRLFSQVGLNAVVGRSKDEYQSLGEEPARFDEMRPGCFRIDDRIRDMDLGGIWASVNFPSQLSGFCGTVFARSQDAELGHAVLRAWNDWLYEDWWQPYPDRIVPLGITWLADPELGAAEIVRNAERGFTAVTLPEMPHRMGLPSLHSGYWDPILRACEETQTAVCLHVGSSGHFDHAADGPVKELRITLFPVLSLIAAIDWLWSGVAVRFPGLSIVMSEGGIGWVPMLLDRLDYIEDHSGAGGLDWSGPLSPAEVLRRNFSFCSLDDPTTLALRDAIGIDSIMMEVDYPHSDSTWPVTQDLMRKRFEGFPVEDVRKMTHLNASRIFRHPLPAVTLP